MRRLLAGWRSLPLDLRLLYWSTILYGFGYFAYGDLLAPFLRGEGLPVEWVGLFFSATTAVGALATLAGGFAADRAGVRPVIIAGRLLCLLGVLALVAGRSLPFFVLAALAWGLEYGAAPARMALLARCTSPANRATALGIWDTFGSIPGTLAPALGGCLADRFGPRSALAVAVPFVAASALVLRGLASPVRTEAAAPTGGLRGEAVGLLRLYRGETARGLIGASVLWFLIGLEMGLLRPVTRLLVVDAFDASWLAVGLVGTVSAVASMVAAPGGGVLADRHGRVPIAVAGFLLGAAAFAVLPWAPRLELAYLAFFLVVLVVACNGPALGAMMLEAAPAAYRGRFTGLTTTLMMLGMAAGSAPAGWLYRTARWLPFLVASGLELTMAAVVLVTFRRAKAGE